ncbi:MAG: universal stress protein [Polyangiales bacterium]
MMRTILVALDGSPRAPGVAAAAAEIGRRFGATLIPLRAVSIPPEFPPAAHVVLDDPLPAHLERTALTELAQRVAGIEGAWARPIARIGQPWRTILEVAEERNVDLIVLGSHGYHGIDHVLGTTAAKVTNSARTNVLVVHERPARPELGTAKPPGGHGG